MITQTNKRSTRIERDPFYNLERELKIRGFSIKTRKTYLYYNKDLVNFARKNFKSIRINDIKEYLLHLKDRNLSVSTINTALNAIKFYYTQILRRKFFIKKEIARPKKDKKLPAVFNKYEIMAILSAVNNVKHKLILAIMYSSGLRVSEVVKIKIGDIDWENLTLKIKYGKGKKDRITVISAKVAYVLKKYLKNKNANDYVFNNRNGENKLTTRSIQKIFSNALKKSGIKKDAGCHSLRHSFATHLLENGVSIRYIQELLGHSRLETTQIYTKVANSNLKNIKSPLD